MSEHDKAKDLLWRYMQRVVRRLYRGLIFGDGMEGETKVKTRLSALLSITFLLVYCIWLPALMVGLIHAVISTTSEETGLERIIYRVTSLNIEEAVERRITQVQLRTMNPIWVTCVGVEILTVEKAKRCLNINLLALNLKYNQELTLVCKRITRTRPKPAFLYMVWWGTEQDIYADIPCTMER